MSARLPFPLYGEPPFEAKVIDASGAPIVVRVSGYSEEARLRCRYRLLHDWLEQRRVVHRSRLGATKLIMLDLPKVVKVFDEMTAAGHFFYEGLGS